MLPPKTCQQQFPLWRSQCYNIWQLFSDGITVEVWPTTFALKMIQEKEICCMIYPLYTWCTRANEMRSKKELSGLIFMYSFKHFLRHQSQKCCWCWFKNSFGQWVSFLLHMYSRYTSYVRCSTRTPCEKNRLILPFYPYITNLSYRCDSQSLQSEFYNARGLHF